MPHYNSNGRLFQIVALVAASLTLSACGASKTSKATANPSAAAVNYSLAECNGITTNSIGLGGVLSSYYDQVSKTYRDDLARVRLNALPAGIADGATKYLQIFRWQINTATGQPVYQSNPISIVFVIRTTGEYLNLYSPVTTLSQNSLGQIINSYNLASRGISINNFFEHILLVLTGLSANDDALTFALYDTRAGTTAQGQVNVLLPAFYANPYYYRQARPWAALYDLHPNNAMAQNLSDADYVNATNTFCQGFF